MVAMGGAVGVLEEKKQCLGLAVEGLECQVKALRICLWSLRHQGALGGRGEAWSDVCSRKIILTIAGASEADMPEFGFNSVTF